MSRFGEIRIELIFHLRENKKSVVTKIFRLDGEKE